MMEFLIPHGPLGRALLVMTLPVGALEELGILKPPSEEDWPHGEWRGKLPGPLPL